MIYSNKNWTIHVYACDPIMGKHYCVCYKGKVYARWEYEPKCLRLAVKEIEQYIKNQEYRRFNNWVETVEVNYAR